MLLVQNVILPDGLNEEPNAQSEEQASDMSNSDEDTEHDRPFYVTSYGRHSKPPSHLNIYECKWFISIYGVLLVV